MEEEIKKITHDELLDSYLLIKGFLENLNTLKSKQEVEDEK